VAILVIATIGYLGWKQFGDQEETAQIQTASVEKGSIVSSVAASGQILASNITSVNTRASGIVKKVYVTDGDTVAAGQTIADIALDESGKQNQLTSYAAYLAAKSSLTGAEINYHTLQSSMFGANQKFINDAVARELAEDDPTYIQERADWLAAEARFNNNQVDINKAKATLSGSYLNYLQSRSTITAPTAGTINSVTIAEGMVLNPSEAGLRVVSIATEGKLLASLSVSEIDVTTIKPGQRATLTLDSISGKTFAGKVSGVDRVGTTTNNVTSYPIIVEFDTSSDLILPNMATSANIIIETRSDVLLVSSQAISYQSGQAYVTVIENGLERSVEVEVGISNDSQTEILSGLSEGDIVTTGTVSTSSSSSQNSGGGNFMFGSAPAGGAARMAR